MATIEIGGAALHYEDSGGDEPVLLFSHGLLWSTALYRHQVAHFRGRFRCVAYDHRGQGRSAVPAMRSIDMETLYRDAVALIEKLGLAPVHFVGLSMGGFVGQRLAARRPDLVRSLILLETSADPEPPGAARRYKMMATVVRVLGVRPVAGRVMPIMFGRTFLADPARAAEREEWRRQLLANRRDIWRAVNGVCERAGVHHELARVRAPTLVVVGDEDVATPLSRAERIHGAIAGSQLVRIPGAGHTSTVEQPAAVNAALERFLAGVA